MNKEIKTVSIDMSTCDEDAENRIFGKVIDKEGDNIICEFESANYDFKQNDIIKKLQQNIKDLEQKNNKLIKCLEFYKDGEFLCLKNDDEGILRIFEINDKDVDVECGTYATQTLKDIGYLK